MSSLQYIVCPPAISGRHVTLPYMSALPEAGGRRLPNGMRVVTDEAFPSLFFKFSPWRKSDLAFNEVDIYSLMQGWENADGIVRLVGVSATQEHFVRVMECAGRGSLDRFLMSTSRGDHEAIDVVLARSFLTQIARGMESLHAMGLVHRDLKAENVLLFDADAESGAPGGLVAKVSDFDRAVALPAGMQLSEPVGSLFHMAPELLAWEEHDRKVDVYAFGILMFEVLHGGARPHMNVGTCMPDSISQEAFARKVVEEGLRPVWRHGDEELRRFAERCWAANPQERPEFSDIRAWLEASAGERAEAGSPTPVKMDAALRGIEGVGIATDIGKARRTMEDAVGVLKTRDGLIACVFDGLRGARTSTFAARQFPLMLARALEYLGNAGVGGYLCEQAVASAFHTLDSSLRDMEPPIECGSTALAAVLRRDELLIAWLGDSPAYLFRRAEEGVSVTPLIKAHHPGRTDEDARVAAEGGIVRREFRMMDSGEQVPWGPLRVFVPASGQGGGIALSRAVGLFAFKPAIGGAPEMLRLAREENDLFLILGSDGVFEVLDPQAVQALVAAASSPQAAADAVMEAVLRNGAPDNASVIVVDLRRL